MLQPDFTRSMQRQAGTRLMQRGLALTASADSGLLRRPVIDS